MKQPLPSRYAFRQWRPALRSVSEGYRKGQIYLFSFWLLAACTLSGAPTIERIEITEYGIYAADVLGEVKDKNVVGGTRDSLENFTLVAQTNRVPATFCTRFGFRYTIHGNPEGAIVALKMVGNYPSPGLVDPVTGKTHLRDEYLLDMAVGSAFTSYSFDHDWELVPGEWKFEIWHQDKKMAEKSFTIFKPKKGIAKP